VNAPNKRVKKYDDFDNIEKDKIRADFVSEVAQSYRANGGQILLLDGPKCRATVELIAAGVAPKDITVCEQNKDTHKIQTKKIGLDGVHLVYGDMNEYVPETKFAGAFLDYTSTDIPTQAVRKILKSTVVNGPVYVTFTTRMNTRKIKPDKRKVLYRIQQFRDAIEDIGALTEVYPYMRGCEVQTGEDKFEFKRGTLMCSLTLRAGMLPVEPSWRIRSVIDIIDETQQLHVEFYLGERGYVDIPSLRYDYLVKLLYASEKRAIAERRKVYLEMYRPRTPAIVLDCLEQIKSMTTCDLGILSAYLTGGQKKQFVVTKQDPIGVKQDPIGVKQDPIGVKQDPIISEKIVG